MPKAYLNAFVEVPDFQAFHTDYILPSGKILTRYGGTILAATNEVETKEDAMPPGYAVLLEFPSMEKLQGFYKDPEYAPLIELRRAQGSSALVCFSGQ